MTDPSRIADDEDAEGAALLHAARGDSPPAKLLERTLLAVSTASAVSLAPAAAAAKATKVGSAAVLKYVLVGVVALGGAAAIRHFEDDPVAPATPPAAPPAAARRSEPPATNPAQAPESSLAADIPPPSRKPTPAAPSPHDAGHALRAPSMAKHAGESLPLPPSADVIADSAMAVEVRLLDDARRALAGGRARDALEVLARYAREAPSRRLAQEAAYMEMEANLSIGDRIAATRSAKNLLRRYPRGPHASRARRILQVE